jgi:hypothetical protein
MRQTLNSQPLAHFFIFLLNRGFMPFRFAQFDNMCVRVYSLFRQWTQL